MKPAEGGIWFLRPFFRWFDRIFFRARDRYLQLVGHSLSKKIRYVVIFLLIVAAMGFLFQRMPTAYLPDEDQGILMVQAMLPANSTLEQTEKVMEGVKDYFLEHEKDAVESCMTISGAKLLRPGTERGHGIRQAQGLGTPQPAGPEGRCRGRKSHGGIFQDPQRHGVCLSRRRRSSNWAWPRGLIFSCWTGAVWATPT